MSKFQPNNGLIVKSPFMDVRQAAVYLGISTFTLYKLVVNKAVPAAKVGGSWRFSKTALDKFIADQSAKSVVTTVVTNCPKCNHEFTVNLNENSD